MGMVASCQPIGANHDVTASTESCLFASPSVGSKRRWSKGGLVRVLCLIASFMTVFACTSNYVPKSRGKIAVVMENGALVYHRDGQRYQQGAFGGGLVNAVKGVPEAEDAARTYRKRTIWGFLMALGSIPCLAIPVAMALQEDPNAGATLGVTTGCAALSVGGLLMVTTAVPYQYDAINIFNDASMPPPELPLPGQHQYDVNLQGREGQPGPPGSLRFRRDE
jgi:hypothetical protein